MKSESNKVFVLGLDGASWNLLRPLMQNGQMPNLQKVCEKGVSGNLQSTKPPYTGPAWVSSITGVNPGKHGIFGFTAAQEGDHQRSLISSRNIRAAKLWQYLDKAGKVSGFINVPVTYPVERLNGFMISGFLAPQAANDITYPLDLYKNLIEELGTYIVNVKISGRVMQTEDDALDFINDILFCTQKRFEAMQLLWHRYSPDFLMIVFSGLDKVQHKFWKFMDRNEPLYQTAMAEKLRPQLFAVYRLMDKIIGTIMNGLDNGTTLFVISDHGFGPLKKRVFINSWLKQQKLLSFKTHRAYLNKILGLTRMKNFNFSRFGIGIRLDNPVDQMIDFSKTLFYGSDVYEQGIYLNSQAENVKLGKIRSEHELKRLEAKISELQDPENGELFVDEVLRREDVYWGPYVDQAPNLLLKMKNYGYLLNKSIPIRGNRLLNEVTGPEGCHRSDGIFAAYGRHIGHLKDLEASIMDITPTVLYAMDMALPENLDGKPLSHIFSSDFQSKNRLRFSAENIYAEKKHHPDRGYNRTEEKEIRERLKELGYLD